MSLSKSIETGANVATIILAAVLGVAVLRGELVQPAPAIAATSATRQPVSPKVGMDLTRTELGVNWAANKRTLVLGLQTGCHFCTDSAPFFQKLTGAAAGKTKILAILPQTVDESEQYLAKLSVRVDDVKSAPLSEIAVAGTPTLLLVDDKGIVKNVWVGKLPDNRQAEVLSAIAP